MVGNVLNRPQADRAAQVGAAHHADPTAQAGALNGKQVRQEPAQPRAQGFLTRIFNQIRTLANRLFGARQEAPVGARQEAPVGARQEAPVSSENIFSKWNDLTKIEQKFHNAFTSQGLKDFLVKDENDAFSEINDIYYEVEENLDSSMLTQLKESLTTMKELGLPESEISKLNDQLEGFDAMLHNVMCSAATLRQMDILFLFGVDGGAIDSADPAQQKNIDKFIDVMCDAAPEGGVWNTATYLNCAVGPFVEALSIGQFPAEQMTKLLGENMPKYAEIIAQAKVPHDVAEIKNAVSRDIHKVMTAGMDMGQQFNYYTNFLFGGMSEIFQDEGALPKADGFSQQDLDALKQVMDKKYGNGEITYSTHELLDSYTQIMADKGLNETGEYLDQELELVDGDEMIADYRRALGVEDVDDDDGVREARQRVDLGVVSNAGLVGIDRDVE
jgi:hypothetical protein